MNYAELIAEIAERVGDPSIVQRARQLVPQAEAELSQRFQPFEYPGLAGIVSAGTNWLLSTNQEIYIAAVLKQYYLLKLDTEKAQAADIYLNTLVDAKKVSDRVLRYSGEKPAIGVAHP